MPKPHRVIIDRVFGYADEAGAFVRRRRLTRRPFIRLYYPDGRSVDLASSDEGEGLFETAGRLIEMAGERPGRKVGKRER